MQGYGFTSNTKNLAIANWPQFFRNRFTIGPAERVIGSMFEAIQKQHYDSIESTPLPVEFNCGDISLSFEDLWSTFD